MKKRRDGFTTEDTEVPQRAQRIGEHGNGQNFTRGRTAKRGGRDLSCPYGKRREWNCSEAGRCSAK